MKSCRHLNSSFSSSRVLFNKLEGHNRLLHKHQDQDQQDRHQGEYLDWLLAGLHLDRL